MATWVRFWLSAQRRADGQREKAGLTDSAATLPLLEEEGLELEKDEGQDPTQRAHFPRSISASAILFFNLGIFILSVLFYAFRFSTAATDTACARRMWPFSPEMKILEFEWRQYDSDVIPREYFGIPTQERRESWDRLWTTGRISFPYEKLASINKSIETHDWWRLPPPRDNEVIVMSEGMFSIFGAPKLLPCHNNISPAMHQVHCVGLLWLFAHRNEFDIHTITNKTEVFLEIHNRHCSVVLLSMIKCQADVTPVPFQRDGDDSGPGSGLGKWKTRDAPHRCKNSEALAKWERENQICPMLCVPKDIARIYPSEPAENG